MAQLTLTPPSPAPAAPRDAASLAHVAHATSPTLHSLPSLQEARTPRLASPHATFDLPVPPTILAAPRAWTLQRRAGAAHAQVVRARDLRAQAPRAPPPRRS